MKFQPKPAENEPQFVNKRTVTKEKCRLKTQNPDIHRMEQILDADASL